MSVAGGLTADSRSSRCWSPWRSPSPPSGCFSMRRPEANAWLARNPKRRMRSSAFVWRPRCCGGTCWGRAPVRLTDGCRSARSVLPIDRSRENGRPKCRPRADVLHRSDHDPDRSRGWSRRASVVEHGRSLVGRSSRSGRTGLPVVGALRVCRRHAKRDLRRCRRRRRCGLVYGDRHRGGSRTWPTRSAVHPRLHGSHGEGGSDQPARVLPRSRQLPADALRRAPIRSAARREHRRSSVCLLPRAVAVERDASGCGRVELRVRGRDTAGTAPGGSGRHRAPARDGVSAHRRTGVRRRPAAVRRRSASDSAGACDDSCAGRPRRPARDRPRVQPQRSIHWRRERGS